MIWFEGLDHRLIERSRLVWNYLVLAIDLNGASKQLAPSHPNCQEARYLLLGQAVELALKAFLVLKDVPRDELMRSFGHDLIKASDACQVHGLDLDDFSIETISILHDAYKRHLFRYGMELASTASMPVLEELQEAADTIIRKVQNSVPRCSFLMISA